MTNSNPKNKQTIQIGDSDSALNIMFVSSIAFIMSLVGIFQVENAHDKLGLFALMLLILLVFWYLSRFVNVFISDDKIILKTLFHKEIPYSKIQKIAQKTNHVATGSLGPSFVYKVVFIDGAQNTKRKFFYVYWDKIFYIDKVQSIIQNEQH